MKVYSQYNDAELSNKVRRRWFATPVVILNFIVNNFVQISDVGGVLDDYYQITN